MKSTIATLLVVVSVAITAQAQTLTLNRVPADVVTFNGQPFTNYKLQTSTNLNDWTDKAIVYGNASGVYGYTNFPTGPQLYYRTIQLAPGALGQVSVKISDTSPLNRIVQVSESVDTENVVLAVYDVKATTDAALRSLKLTINTSNASCVDVFSDLKIWVNGLTYSADSIVVNSTNQATVTFLSLVAIMPINTWVPIKVLGRVVVNTGGHLDGVQASVTLECYGTNNVTGTNPTVEDGQYNTLPVTASTNTSATTTFSSASALVSDTQITLGTPIESNGVIVGYPVQLDFTLTAADETLFLSRNGPIVGSSGQSLIQAITDLDTMFGLTSVSTAPEVVTGDTVEYFVVPAGSSRQFSLAGTITKAVNGPVMVRSAKVIGIAYGLTPYSLYGYHITHGIEGLEIEHLTF